MTYKEAQEYLLNSYGAGRKKGLEEMGFALKLLGYPQYDLKIIHVAGTNGKGSFCAMMGSILQEAGCKVGAFTSPHIEDVEERFTINGEKISKEDFAKTLYKVVDVSEFIFEDEGDGFSYFEILTLMAFVYFAEKNVDVVLLEVGIGGRLDATNVVAEPILSVIMRIGFDHMEILGNTLEEIAWEKGGIIKENCPVVLYDDVDLVYNVFKKIADYRKAEIHHAKDVDLFDFEIGLLGEHQRKNAQVVLTAARALVPIFGSRLQISNEVLENGFANARHPARMEIMSRDPIIILEGAHNLQGASACAENMQVMFAGRDITVVIGIVKDKEIGEIVRVLTSFAGRVIFTRSVDGFKATDPKELREIANLGSAEQYDILDCGEALEKAKEITPKDGVILCTGSLYLMGDLRKHLHSREA
ncbi:MAG: bifunctional folylpolyglutamate synthase/dihydrofolate synthase [Defluviitaleaceae bacterium]|nr:bifunctional folylpolyglutamate synthase/dihydrofolate synthase [Defluviitaleaceae bacterium]